MDPVTIGNLAKTGGAVFDLFGGGGTDVEAMWREQNKVRNFEFWRNAKLADRARREDRRWADLDWRRAAARADQEWRRNAAQQERFAKMGIQWRVQDARRAGLHPVYALGGSGVTFSPAASVSPGGSSTTGPYLGDPSGPTQRPTEDRSSANLDALLQLLASQNVSAAAAATQDPMDAVLAAAQLELLSAGAAKDRAVADYYHSEARRKAAPGRSKGVPAPTAPQSGGVGWKRVPREVEHARPGRPGTQAGPPKPMWDSYVNDEGDTIYIPASDLAESTEGVGAMTLTALKNSTLPKKMLTRAVKRDLGKNRDWWARQMVSAYKAYQQAYNALLGR